MIVIVSTYVIGLAYWFVNRKNSIILQKSFGWSWYCVICGIGTIIHELSHLVTAVIFFHTPTKVELFRPTQGKIDGVLGVVEHSYKKTYYCMAGNFFIGCAPMVVGSFISMNLLRLIKIDVVNIGNNLINFDKRFLLSSFNNIDYKNPITYIVLFVTISIAISMNMSSKDVQNSLVGIPSLFVVVLIIYINSKLFGDIGKSSSIFTSICLGYIKMLLLGLLISIMTLIFNRILSIFINLGKKL